MGGEKIGSYLHNTTPLAEKCSNLEIDNTKPKYYNFKQEIKKYVSPIFISTNCEYCDSVDQVKSFFFSGQVVEVL